jgi:hypothetical protein
MPSNKTNPIIGIIDRRLDVSSFRDQHWEGAFWDYLDVVHDNPTVSRNAFQRVYDMILSVRHGDVHTVQAGDYALQVLLRSDRSRRRRHLRPRKAAHDTGGFLQIRLAGLRH